MPTDRSHPRRVLSPEYALLGLLVSGPSHGYDLHQRLMVELGSIWHVSQSQAYSILRRLEQRGDIATQRGQASKQPRRQVLHITSSGRRRFLQWLKGSANAGARTVRLEFLTRLYFANLLAPNHVEGIYAMQVKEIDRTLQRLRLSLVQIPEGQPFNRMSLDLRLRQMELVRLWLQEIRVK
jgi:DNA-binding PadR family transcriptional regulator